MKRILILLALLLTVPALGLVTANYVQSQNDDQLRQALREQYPDAPADKLAAVTVTALCAERTTEIEEVCSTNDTLALMKGASGWAIGIGLALLLLIRLAGTVAKGDRTTLLWIFKPGLYLTAAVLVGLVLTHAALAIGTIYYGEAALVGRVHFGILLAIGIGAILGAFAIIRHSFAILHNATTEAIGISLSRADAPALWAAIDNTAGKLGSLVPDHAVIGLEPNFYVTEANVTCLSGSLRGRTLYCSLPLARIMSRDEFISVIGHELGHFKGEDTKFSAKFYPIYRGTTDSLNALRHYGGEGAAGLALLPAIGIFGYFLDSFSTAESRISRERELAADREGASVATSSAIAAALVKLHAFSGVWNDLQLAAVDALKEGHYFPNMSKLFAERAAEIATPEVLDGIDTSHLSHPTDSHPSLATRLQALGLSIADVSEASLRVPPQDSAISLFENLEECEEGLSEQAQLHLANLCGIHLPEQAQSADASSQAGQGSKDARG